MQNNEFHSVKYPIICIMKLEMGFMYVQNSQQEKVFLDTTYCNST